MSGQTDRQRAAGIDCQFCIAERGAAGRRVALGIIVVVKRQRIEILRCQNSFDIGLCIDQVDRRLLEAVAAVLTDVAGILTVRTCVDGL